MRGTLLLEVFTTFLGEATSLLGWPLLIIVFGMLLFVGGGVLWILAKFLSWKEEHLGAVLSSLLLLTLVAGLLGVVYLAAMLSEFASPARGGSPFLLQLSVWIAVALVFTCVHGAFGTSWCKAAILTLAFLASTGWMVLFAIPKFFTPEKTKLSLLARQCAGATTEEPWLVKSEAANQRIRMRQVRRKREELLTRQATLVQAYTNLRTERERLDPKDSIGLQIYNKRMADYAQKTRALRAELARVDALLTAERSQL